MSASHRATIHLEDAEVLVRVAEHGDLFAPVLELKQKPPKLS